MKDPELLRVGDKLISRQKIDSSIDRILELRGKGLSQQQVAAQVGVDRTFVSRLETLGEVRKGRSMALVGFPVANKEELAQVAASEGLDFVLLMTNRERWRYVEDRSGADLLAEVMELISHVRRHDAVILIGSDERNRAAQALIDGEVFRIDLGASPIAADITVDPERLRRLIREMRHPAQRGDRSS